MLTVLMYHFIHSDRDSSVFSGIPGITLEEFEKQIQVLLGRMAPISHKDLVHYFEGDTSLVSSDSFYMTFDEGLKQHFSNVLPLLSKYGLTASFFVPTRPLSEGLISLVEKQRICQYSIFSQYSEFLEQFCETYAVMFPGKGKPELEPTAKNITACHAYLAEHAFYSDEERFFRKIRNEYIDQSEFDAVIDSVFLKKWRNERDFIEQYYMNWIELKELCNAGMTIGGHSHSHPMMTNIELEKSRDEVNMSHSLLRKNLCKEVESFAYPFGVFNGDLIELIEQSMIKYSFTTLNDSNQFPLEKHAIKRIDAAAFEKVISKLALQPRCYSDSKDNA